MKKVIKRIFRNPYILTLIVVTSVVVLIPELWHIGKGQIVEGRVDIYEHQARTTGSSNPLDPSKTIDGDKQSNKTEQIEEKEKDVEKVKSDGDIRQNNTTIEVEIPTSISVNKPQRKSTTSQGSGLRQDRPSNVRTEDKPIVTVKEEITTESINFSTTKKNDGNLEKGKNKVEREGKKGTRTITYKISYTNGEESSREVVSDQVTEEPVNEIIAVGTKEPKAAETKASSNSISLPNNYSYNNHQNLEDYMIKLVNDYRVSNGLNKLEKRNDLNSSARYKSQSMLQLNYFGHNNPNFSNNNSSYLIRTALGNSHYSGTGENLTASSTSDRSNSAATKAFDRFKASSTHNKNMLNPNWKYIGVGILGASKSGSQFKGLSTMIVTQHFAK